VLALLHFVLKEKEHNWLIRIWGIKILIMISRHIITHMGIIM
jgi:hypothetical protein